MAFSQNVAYKYEIICMHSYNLMCIVAGVSLTKDFEQLRTRLLHLYTWAG